MSAGAKKEKKPAKREGRTGRTSVLYKLLDGILIPLLLILVLVGVFMNVRISGAVSDMQDDNLQLGCASSAAQVESFFNKVFGVAETQAANPQIVNTLRAWQPHVFEHSPEAAALKNEMTKVQQAHSENIINLCMTCIPTMELLQSHGDFLSKPGFDVTTREWYQRATGGDKTVVSGAYIDVNTNELVATVAAPVHNGSSIIGVQSMDITVTNLINKLQEIRIGETGYVTVFDSAQNVLCNPNPDYVLKNISELPYSDNLKSAIQNNEAVKSMKCTLDGETYYCSTSYLDSINYLVLGVMPEAEYMDHIHETRNVTFFSFLLCILVLSVIIFLYAKSFVRSLKQLASASQQLAEGQLDVEINVKSNDEIGELAHDTQAIVDRLKEYIAYIDEIRDRKSVV